jgi:outer membrane protein TolC
MHTQSQWSTIVAAVLVACGATLSVAQEPGKPLTLTRAIEVALVTSPLLQAAQHQVEAATAAIAQARAAFLPKLQAQESLTWADNPVFAFSSKLNQGRFRQDDFAVHRLNHPPVAQNFKTSLALEQPLYTGGKASLGLKQAELLHQASTYSLSRQQQDVILQVVKAYYGVLRVQADLEVLRAALHAAEANRSLAQVRFEAGLVVESDVLSAEVRLATLREQDITATHQLTLSKATLNDVMGLPLETPYEVSERLTQRPSRYPQLEGLEVLALEQRPDYQQLGLEVQTVEHGIALARAAFLPTFSATANYEVNNHTLVGEGQDSWLVGLQVQWNLFNGLADRAKVTAAQADTARLKALRARMASRIQLEVKEAWLILQAAQQRISVAAGAVAHAQESLRLIRERYEAGLTTIVDLLAGEAALTRAQGNLTLALYEQNIGMAALEFALGTMSPESF